MGDKKGCVAEIRLYNVTYFGYHGAEVKDGGGTGVEPLNVFKNKRSRANKVDDVKNFGKKVPVIIIIIIMLLFAK